MNIRAILKERRHWHYMEFEEKGKGSNVYKWRWSHYCQATGRQTLVPTFLNMTICIKVPQVFLSTSWWHYLFLQILLSPCSSSCLVSLFRSRKIPLVTYPGYATVTSHNSYLGQFQVKTCLLSRDSWVMIQLSQERPEFPSEFLVHTGCAVYLSLMDVLSENLCLMETQADWLSKFKNNSELGISPRFNSHYYLLLTNSNNNNKNIIIIINMEQQIQISLLSS